MPELAGSAAQRLTDAAGPVNLNTSTHRFPHRLWAAMETVAHQRLKKLALAFLRQQGCLAAMSEVRCPISRFRVDAVGYMDRPPLDQQPNSADRRTRPIEPKTIVIECKQSRSDFLRDSEAANELIALRSQLDRIRRSIEEYRIKREEPQLQQTGTSLF